MSLEVIGKVVQLGQRQTGEGKTGNQWVKQELIIETEDQYPRKICLMCWAEKADEARSFGIGEKIKASINIESREFNGRWYTDVKPWKFEKMGQAAGEDMPYDAVPDSQSKGGEFEDSAADDLPF